MLSDLYPPVIGGGERHVRSLSIELAKRGQQVSVCTIGHRGLAKYEEDEGIKIHRLEGLFQKVPFLFKDPRRKWHPPTRDRLITKQLSHIVEGERPDIIHAHGRILYSALPLKKRFGIPIVVTLHSYFPFCPRTDLMRGNAVCDKPFTRECISCGKDFYGLAKSLFAYFGVKTSKNRLRSVDKFIAVSSFVKDVHVKHLGLGDSDLVMIPNFYHPEINGQRGKAGGLPEDYILFVGALIPDKGVNVLIQAFQKLDTRTKLVLIGGTHPDYRYQSTQNILIIEDVPHDVVMQAFSSCKFAVFPSIWPEPFGIVAIEAMSQRKAVIASDIGGLKDIVVDGETGIIVPPNDLDRLAEAISYLLRRPETALEMGQKGYNRFVKNYTPDVVVPRIVEIYQGLI